MASASRQIELRPAAEEISSPWAPTQVMIPVTTTSQEGPVTRGRGWLGRNWMAVVGLAMFALAAVADAQAVAAPGWDWYALFVWGVLAGVLVVLWLVGKDDRDRWKAARDRQASAR